MGWSESELLTCSAEGFYYISQGYFDKEEFFTVVMRKVAESASAGHVDNFNDYWPAKEAAPKDVVIDFDSEDYKNWYAEMKIKNNIK